MGRNYFKKSKYGGHYTKTGHSKTDAEIKKDNAGEFRFILMAIAAFCAYLLIVYLYDQTLILIRAINDPSNLIQPYKFLAYYCNYIFFKPIFAIGYYWEVVVTNGLTKFKNFNFIIFFSSILVMATGCAYAFYRLKEATKLRIFAVVVVIVAIPFVLIVYWIYVIIAAMFGWIFA